MATPLFSRRFREGISFPNFLERSTLKLPFSKPCDVHLALQNRALSKVEKRAEKVLREGLKEGLARKGSETPRCPYNRFVHKIAFLPPPGKSVNSGGFILICTVFPHFGPFSGGGGVKPNFADKNFMDTQTFLKGGKKENRTRENRSGYARFWCTQIQPGR